jgi:hypothetical protein
MKGPPRFFEMDVSGGAGLLLLELLVGGEVVTVMLGGDCNEEKINY